MLGAPSGAEPAWSAPSQQSCLNLAATAAHRRNDVVGQSYMNMRPLCQQQLSETVAVA